MKRRIFALWNTRYWVCFKQKMDILICLTFCLLYPLKHILHFVSFTSFNVIEWPTKYDLYYKIIWMKNEQIWAKMSKKSKSWHLLYLTFDYSNVMDSSTVQYERVALKKGSKIYWQKILISCKKIYKDINLNCQHFVFASKHVLSLHCHHCKVQGLLTSSSPVCICFFLFKETLCFHDCSHFLILTWLFTLPHPYHCKYRVYWPVPPHPL